MKLLKADPEVDAGVKRDLKPCVGDEYPVDVSYGDLTGAKVSDVVINVLTCGDAVGVGAYVYRVAAEGKAAEEAAATQGYVNVFRNETPPSTPRSTGATWWSPGRCTTRATRSRTPRARRS